MQDRNLFFGDGIHTICLSTHGEDGEKVSKELVKFLKYVRADINKSTGDFEDDFVTRLQKSVHHVKKSREMEERYMLFEELLKTERKEGKVEVLIEAITELLEDYGTLPESLKERLEGETNLNTLKVWHKMAAKAESIEQFMRDIQTEQQ